MKSYIAGAIIFGILFGGFTISLICSFNELKFPTAIPGLVLMLGCGVGMVFNIVWYNKTKETAMLRKGMCSVCGQNQVAKTLTDGGICKNCITQCTTLRSEISWKNVSAKWAADCIAFKTENTERNKIFSKTKAVKKYFEIDETNKLWKAPSAYPQIVFAYNEIIDFELLENGISYSKGGLGSAVVGGALFGGVGAIVGSNVGKKTQKEEITEFRIKIITKNPVFSEVYIDFITVFLGTKFTMVKGDSNYKIYSDAAHQILSALTIICNGNFTVETPSPSASAADEILKFKQLLDQGVITQEEFDKKKQQLLNI